MYFKKRVITRGRVTILRYQLAEPPTSPIQSQPAADKSRSAKVDAVSTTHDAQKNNNMVKQDQLWKERVQSEMRAAREW